MNSKKEGGINGSQNPSAGDAGKWEELFHRVSHPFPILMIERVVELETGKKIRTIKSITANEFYLSGHFPGEPIVPGVLTVEGFVQSAILLVDEIFSRGRLTCRLEKADRVRFKRAIVPGDRVEFSVQLAAREGERWKFKGQAKVFGEPAAEANLVLRVSCREVGFEI